MLKKKTIFVIGAGAGVDYKMPVGSELATTISNKLNIEYEPFSGRVLSGDADIAGLFRHHFPTEVNLYREAAWKIRNGIHLTNSIDDFLDLHQHDAKINLCGKIAIVKSILEGEKSSRLYVDPINRNQYINFSSLSDTWLVKFFKILGRGSKPEDTFKNVAFINFNYDRCLELFFVQALQVLHGFTEEESRKIFSSAQVFHPYGMIAPLYDSHSNHGVAFGASKVDYVKLAGRIRTYTEKIEETETETIRAIVSEAETLIFLGFAFHDQNMKLITPPKGCNAKTIFATAYNISPNDLSVIRNHLAAMFERNFRRHISNPENSAVQLRNDLHCSSFFDQYNRTLTA